MSTAAAKRWFQAVAELETCVLCGHFGVQVAHENETRGMGQKSSPWNTAALCPTCHYELDNGKRLSQADRRSAMRQAINRTHDRLIRAGKLVLL